MRFPKLALAASLAPLGAASAQERAVTPADWYRVAMLGSAAMSPDGKLAASTRTTVREAENKRHAEVGIVGATGGAPRRVTSPSTESSNHRVVARRERVAEQACRFRT